MTTPLTLRTVVITSKDLIAFNKVSQFKENAIWLNKSIFPAKPSLYAWVCADRVKSEFMLPVKVKCKDCLPLSKTTSESDCLISHTIAQSFGFESNEENTITIHSFIEDTDIIPTDSIQVVFLPTAEQKFVTLHNFDLSIFPPKNMSNLATIFLQEKIISVGSQLHVDWFGGSHTLFVVSTGNNKKVAKLGNCNAVVTHSTTQIQFIDSWYNAYHLFKNENPTAAVSIPKKFIFPSLQEWEFKVQQEFGGYNDIIHQVVSSIYSELQQPNQSPVNFPTCFLLTGIHGTGKTKLGNLISIHSRLPVWFIDGAQVMNSSGIEEETSGKFKELLAGVVETSPSILFIDQLENICPPLYNSETLSSLGSIEAHLETLLKTFLDYIHYEDVTGVSSKTGKKKIFVLATCTGVSQGAIDESFLRAERFDQVIRLNLPSLSQRKDILQILTRKIPLQLSHDKLNVELSKLTHGFVASDLEAICNDALVLAIQRKFENQCADVSCSMEDFLHVVKKIRPANLAEHIKQQFQNEASFDDFGGLDEIISRLKAAVIHGVEKRNLYKSMGISPPSGLLFYGESGTGKTQMVQALANESGLSLISIQGPELISPVVGESEKNISALFYKARASAPCILFLDQIDALAVSRGIGESFSRVRERTLSCLLTEMDGVVQHSENEDNKNIVIIGVTQNRNCLDPAILRPGRLDVHIHFPLPDKVGRIEIFKKALTKTPLAPDISVEFLAEQTQNYSGAEIRNICQEAVIICLREDIYNSVVRKEHFCKAIEFCGEKLKSNTQDKSEQIVKTLETKSNVLFSFQSTIPMPADAPIVPPSETPAPVFKFTWNPRKKEQM